MCVVFSAPTVQFLRFKNPQDFRVLSTNSGDQNYTLGGRKLEGKIRRKFGDW